MNYELSDKHIRMYMRMAEALAHPDHNSCFSRHIGCVIAQTDLPGGRVVSTGFNSPVSGASSPDSFEMLREFVWPQLRQAEKVAFVHSARRYSDTSNAGLIDADMPGAADEACRVLTGCKICPRRLVGAKSGERLELCPCAHAERNAIIRCTESLRGSWLFLWFGSICHECATAIIQAGITHIVMLTSSEPDYSPGSRWLFDQKGIVREYRDPTTLNISRKD